MLPLSISRNRKADREQKVHTQAVQRALERKAIREFVKANPDVLTDEEDLQDSVQEEPKQQHQTEQKNSDQFFDVCNEKIKALSIKDIDKEKKSKKKSKKSEKSLKKRRKFQEKEQKVQKEARKYRSIVIKKDSKNDVIIAKCRPRSK